MLKADFANSIDHKTNERVHSQRETPQYDKKDSFRKDVEKESREAGTLDGEANKRTLLKRNSLKDGKNSHQIIELTRPSLSAALNDDRNDQDAQHRVNEKNYSIIM